MIRVLLITLLLHGTANALEKNIGLKIGVFQHKSPYESVNEVPVSAKFHLASDDIVFFADYYVRWLSPKNKFMRYQKGDTQISEIKELYVDYNSNNHFFRFGKQSLRWGESWSLPSLDIWSKRNWQHHLLTPVDVWVRNPVGILHTLASDKFQFDTFYNFNPAEENFIVPELNEHVSEADIAKLNYIVSNLEQDKGEGEYGMRATLFTSGWDTKIMLAHLYSNPLRPSRTLLGGFQVSKSYKDYVFKQESMMEEGGSKFFTLGVDSFFGNITLSPQITYADTNNISYPRGTIYYLSEIYDNYPFSQQMQGYYNSRTKERFVILEGAYQFKSKIKYYLRIQDYYGESPFGILYHYRYMVDKGVISTGFDYSVQF